VVEFSSSTLTELSDLLSRDVSTLSSALRRLRVQALEQQELGRVMAELEAKLAILQAQSSVNLLFLNYLDASSPLKRNLLTSRAQSDPSRESQR
jgi:hypothetical protein